MVDRLYTLYTSFGLNHSAGELFAVATILLAAAIIGYVIYHVLHRTLNYHISHLVKRKPSRVVNILSEEHLMGRLVMFVPPLLIFMVLPFLLKGQTIEDITNDVIKYSNRAITTYMLFLGAVLADRCFVIVERIYNLYPISKEWPIRSYVQFIKVFVFIFFAILIIATLIDESPIVLITGLGAVMAIVILVFKDAILSFVASLQLASSKMMKAGDWVELPDKGISGTIIEMSLNTIKIENFDKTISMVPPYYMTLNSVKNWQGMFESGGRRIKRAIFLDLDTVCFTSLELLDKLAGLPLLEKYIQENKAFLEKGGTNIELFRRYIELYIASKTESFYTKGFTCMARQLAPNAVGGIPLEVYAFTTTTVWTEYELVQSELFAHLVAMLPVFNLKPYQQA